MKNLKTKHLARIPVRALSQDELRSAAAGRPVDGTPLPSLRAPVAEGTPLPA